MGDVGNVACKKDRDSTYGKNNVYRLHKEGSEFKAELDSFLVYLKFPVCLCVRVYVSPFDDWRFALKQKTEAATISRSTMFFCPGNNTNSMQPSMHRKITVTI